MFPNFFKHKETNKVVFLSKDRVGVCIKSGTCKSYSKPGHYSRKWCSISTGNWVKISEKELAQLD